MQRTYQKIEEGRVRPIHLTPELLEQCGLKTANILDGGMLAIRLEPEYEQDERPLGIWAYSGLGNPSDYGFKFDIKFVHQLQNLYFTLTGQELEINLSTQNKGNAS